MQGPWVIGEVGGSASRWAVIEDGAVTALFPRKGAELPGFNPLNGDAGLFTSALLEHFTLHGPGALAALRCIVYGAGCGNAERQRRMRDVLAAVWPHASITVESDLMGAARGLLGRQAGLVLILGTGMNAGWFDGTELHRPMPSLGWVLGDEGSGADIGRTLLQDAFYRRMPEEVRALLFGPGGPDLDSTLAALHGSPFPSKTLASHAALLPPYVELPYVRELLTGRFTELAGLLADFFTPEQRAAARATGSVAWAFREVLAECLLERGITLMDVERDPLQGLVRHHLGGAR